MLSTHVLWRLGKTKLIGSRSLQNIMNWNGEPVVFEWKVFPGHTTLKLLQEVRSSMEEKHIRPEGLIQIRGHFGSGAISVQVNIVAVSDHVFHRFPFDLLIQVSATKLSLFWCFPSIFHD